MPITNLGTLKSEMASYLYDRKDLTDRIPQFIDLGERRIFRALRCRANETRVTGALADTVISQDRSTIDLPADLIEFKFLAVNGRPLERKSELEYLTRINNDDAGGEPSWFARVTDEIRLWRPGDSDYGIEYVYWQNQAGTMVDDADATAVLTYAPELYLYASLLSAMPWLVKDDRIPTWQGMYDDALMEIDHETKEGEYAGSTVGVSSPYTDPIRGVQSGRRL